MTLRELWESKRATIGGWCRIPSAYTAELMARAGYDWVCVDTQHGLAGRETMVSMLQALAIARVPSFVRVAWNHPDLIMRALDAGAEGIVVPMVNTAEDARSAVMACRYAPDGFRSWGPTRASLGRPDYSPTTANSNVVCMVMIETREAIDNLDDILNVSGVDGAYVGPNDLAVSMGMLPNVSSTTGQLAAATETVLAACQRHRVAAGIHCGTVEVARHWRDQGFLMLTVANDGTFVATSAAEVVKSFRVSTDRRLGVAPNRKQD